MALAWHSHGTRMAVHLHTPTKACLTLTSVVWPWRHVSLPWRLVSEMLPPSQCSITILGRGGTGGGGADRRHMAPAKSQALQGNACHGMRVQRRHRDLCAGWLGVQRTTCTTGSSSSNDKGKGMRSIRAPSPAAHQVCASRSSASESVDAKKPESSGCCMSRTLAAIPSSQGGCSTGSGVGREASLPSVPPTSLWRQVT